VSFKHIIKIIEFKKFIFGFDNDIESKAGDNARLKAANKIFSVDPTKQIFCADFPPGKDPNKCTPEELKESFSKLKRVILK
jgi:DNA primase